MNSIAVVILNYNTKTLSINCIDSILSKSWKNHFSIYFVDNASSDGSVGLIREKYKNVKISENSSNLGFAKGNNSIIKTIYKKYDYVLILNSDTLIKNRSLDYLIKFSQQKDIGIISCRLENSDGTLQPNAGSLPYPIATFLWISGLDDFFYKLIHLPVPTFHEVDSKYYYGDRTVGWVSGSVMLIKKSVFQKIGFFDESIFMYTEDVDFCWRATKAGFKVGWTDTAQIIHLGGKSSGDKAQYNQWLGEFKGIIYLYKKYFGKSASLIIQAVIKFFVILRIIAFTIVTKPSYAKTYAKIFTKI